MKCSCGGTLRPGKLKRFDMTGVTALGEVRVDNVDGLRCNRCKATTISGKTMARIELALVLRLIRSQRRLIGNEVRFLREWLGLTQAEMAKRLGVNRVTLANWERDFKRVSRTGSYVLRSVVLGYILGQRLLPAREGQKLAAETLGSAPPDTLPDKIEPYVVAADAW